MKDMWLQPYDSADIEGYLDVAIGSLREGAQVETDLKMVIMRLGARFHICREI